MRSNETISVPVARLEDAMLSGEYVLGMIAHAGTSRRTGSKVHVATMRVWPDGTVTVRSAVCQPLRGSLLTSGDFAQVNCERCGGAEGRPDLTAKMFQMKLTVSRDGFRLAANEEAR